MSRKNKPLGTIDCMEKVVNILVGVNTLYPIAINILKGFVEWLLQQQP